MTFTDDQKRMLSDKLDPGNVKPAPQGKYGDYIEGWHAIAEANRIFGFDGWHYSIVELTSCHEPYENDKKNWIAGYICRVRVTVGGVEREDVGFGSGASKQIGDAHEAATKEAVTDALKRVLRTFGNPFGLALYDKSKANVGIPNEVIERKVNYVQGCLSIIHEMDTVEALNDWWKSQAAKRREHGLTSEEVNVLSEACKTQKALILKSEADAREAGLVDAGGRTQTVLEAG